MSDGSPPPSICFIRAAESYPKSQIEKEDSQLSVPFQELSGESIKYLGRTDDGILALSNYRIFLSKKSTTTTTCETYIPLGLIESVQVRDLFQLIVNCKDASTVRCSFPSAEQCAEWQRRIQLLIGVPETLETLFAFPFYSWTCDLATATTTSSSSTATTSANKERNGNGNGNGNMTTAATSQQQTTNYLSGDYYSHRLQRAVQYENDFKHEVARLGFDLKGSWRISTANADFKLCPSYPQKLLVPFCITDEMLLNVANFRASRRLPAVVWRHKKSGAVLARCSQPEVGWLGWRNYRDEELLKALADACAFDRGEHARRTTNGQTAQQQQQQSPQQMQTQAQTQKEQSSGSGKSSPSLEDSSHEELALDEIRKILIVDARSYTSAVTNRARGGGCECIEYYPCAEIEFMNLGNIHAIRKSFHAVRQLCASSPDDPNWLGQLEKTMWMQHLSGLLGSAMTVVHTIEKKGRPVLVHCSDGWDRTPQIVATAQLCLDPYYRTVEGFRVLVEREWLSFGHKFSDRSGNGPNSDEINERCPVFLQWLDLVHQIHRQFPCRFEFSIGYLIKLAQHSLSCLFGTFLCNSLKERIENSLFDRTFSVWPFLSETMYKNPLYKHEHEKVLWPAHNVRFLYFWSDVYLGSLGNKNGTDLHPSTTTTTATATAMMTTSNNERQNDHLDAMTKTRSSGDLKANEQMTQNNLSRRSSDPNLAAESNNATTDLLNVNSNSMFDIRTGSDGDVNDDDVNDDDDDDDDCVTHVNNNLQDLTLKELQPIVEKKLNNYKTQTQTQTLSSTTTTTTVNSSSPSPSPPSTTTTTTTSSMECNLSTDNNITAQTSDQFNQSINRCANGVTNDIHCDATTTTTTTTTNDKTANDLCDDDGDGDGNGDGENDDKYKEDKEEVDGSRNLWHGHVDTSTDTLIPIETKSSNQSIDHRDDVENDIAKNSTLPTSSTSSTAATAATTTTNIALKLKSEPQANNNSNNNNNNNNNSSSNSSNNKINSQSYSNLPKVHIKPSTLRYLQIANGCTSSEQWDTFPHHLDLQAAPIPSASASAAPLPLPPPSPSPSPTPTPSPSSPLTLTLRENGNKDDQQQQRKHICGSLPTTTTTATATSDNINNYQITDTAERTASEQLNETTMVPATSINRLRRNTLSSNSSRDNAPINTQNAGLFGNVNSSLPPTPTPLDRTQFTLTCPDGLAHALSEENIRLHQIVQEHKIREDILLREIHGMRLALLHKACPSCTSVVSTNVDHENGLDIVENASTCSWEAVEERSGPSSYTTSSINEKKAPCVLWVPDYAASRCSSCQIEFWLGRRKHHCRSCGQIFCADCSEYWAPLPYEKLFNPVRLCGSCYTAVATPTATTTTTNIECHFPAIDGNNMQQQQQQQQPQQNELTKPTQNIQK